MIKIYRKTTKIQAEQFDGSDEMIAKYDVIDSEGAGLFLPTLEGNLEFHISDWIATGVKGEHWAIADKIFKRTYAELPTIPRYVADTIEDYKADHDMGALMYAAVHGALDDGDWILENMETACRAWLDGYRVEG